MSLLARLDPQIFSSIDRLYDIKINHFLKSKDNSRKYIEKRQKKNRVITL